MDLNARMIRVTLESTLLNTRTRVLADLELLCSAFFKNTHHCKELPIVQGKFSKSKLENQEQVQFVPSRSKQRLELRVKRKSGPKEATKRFRNGCNPSVQWEFGPSHIVPFVDRLVGAYLQRANMCRESSWHV